MFAIFMGGGLFGFPGMVLGVPIFAVIYALAEEIAEILLKRKGLPHETEAYYDKVTPEQKDKPKKADKKTV